VDGRCGLAESVVWQRPRRVVSATPPDGPVQYRESVTAPPSSRLLSRRCEPGMAGRSHAADGCGRAFMAMLLRMKCSRRCRTRTVDGPGPSYRPTPAAPAGGACGNVLDRWFPVSSTWLPGPLCRSGTGCLGTAPAPLVATWRGTCLVSACEISIAGCFPSGPRPVPQPAVSNGVSIAIRLTVGLTETLSMVVRAIPMFSHGPRGAFGFGRAGNGPFRSCRLQERRSDTSSPW
jgi:hypothetical protein